MSAPKIALEEWLAAVTAADGDNVEGYTVAELAKALGYGHDHCRKYIIPRLETEGKVRFVGFRRLKFTKVKVYELFMPPQTKKPKLLDVGMAVQCGVGRG